MSIVEDLGEVGEDAQMVVPKRPGKRESEGRHFGVAGEGPRGNG